MGERLTPHFLASEIQCKGCKGDCPWSSNGRPIVHVLGSTLAKLEKFRVLINTPFSPNSACRCPAHNARVGGAPRSLHRTTNHIPGRAFDIPLVRPKKEMIEAAEEAGFKGLGVRYRTFLHIDDRSYKVRF